MPKVNSTAIARVDRSGVAESVVTFHSGDRYAVHCPFGVHKRLRSSRSVGRTYNLEVRDKYPVRKL